MKKPNKRNRRKSKSSQHAYSALEDRRLLATFIVNTASDANAPNDGLVSLREAVTAANTNTAFGDAQAGAVTGDVIWFDPSIAGSTIRLTAGELTITDDVFIQGGTNNITIEGDGRRIFSNNSTERVGFTQLNFIGGRADRGGAIFAGGNTGGRTVIVGSTFNNNEAFVEGGGAIYKQNGDMYIVDSTFTNNDATGVQGSGGAIFSVDGRTYVTRGSMLSNSANSGGGAVQVNDGQYFTFGVQVGAAGAENVAGETDVQPADGGAVRVSGNAFVSINGGSINNNLAARNGGGIWNGPDSSVYVRANAQVTSNIAAGNFTSENGGGGIFNAGGYVYVTNSVVSQNQAAGPLGRGGGIYSESGVLRLTSSRINSNAAVETGGGVQIDSGFAFFVTSELNGNNVGDTFTSGAGLGGALHLMGDAVVVDNGGQFSGNRAAERGGAIYGERDSQLFLRSGSSLRGNVAFNAGSRGGGLYTDGFVQVLNSFFLTNNSFISGGLYVAENGFARIIGSNFNGNTSRTNGGGIYNDGFVRATGTSFVNNVVEVDGGAVFTSTIGETLLSEDTLFSNNSPNDTN
ncbi:MAG: hypothetical protein AB8B55_08755 [Mariniblastus sp.]